VNHSKLLSIILYLIK